MVLSWGRQLRWRQRLRCLLRPALACSPTELRCARCDALCCAVCCYCRYGTFVAAKVLKGSSEIALGDFRSEIEILRRVHHPNAVQVRAAALAG